jgi:hypothetical protein
MKETEQINKWKMSGTHGLEELILLKHSYKNSVIYRFNEITTKIPIIFLKAIEKSQF